MHSQYLVGYTVKCIRGNCHCVFRGGEVGKELFSETLLHAGLTENGGENSIREVQKGGRERHGNLGE